MLRRLTNPTLCFLLNPNFLDRLLTVRDSAQELTTPTESYRYVRNALSSPPKPAFPTETPRWWRDPFEAVLPFRCSKSSDRIGNTKLGSGFRESDHE